MTNEESRLDSFKRGVIDAHVENCLDTEYASLFWGNVFGDQFESCHDAFESGLNVVHETIED